MIAPLPIPLIMSFYRPWCLNLFYSLYIQKSARSLLAHWLDLKVLRQFWLCYIMIMQKYCLRGSFSSVWCRLLISTSQYYLLVSVWTGLYTFSTSIKHKEKTWLTKLMIHSEAYVQLRCSFNWQLLCTAHASKLEKFILIHNHSQVSFCLTHSSCFTSPL